MGQPVLNSVTVNNGANNRYNVGGNPMTVTSPSLIDVGITVTDRRVPVENSPPDKLQARGENPATTSTARG